MNKGTNDSLKMRIVSARFDAKRARSARVKRAATELRAASLSHEPRTSLLDIAWDTVEAPSFPSAAAPREGIPLGRELSTPTSFFHAVPAWAGHSAPRSHAASTIPGLGPALLPPPATRHSNDRPLLTALRIAATVVVAFGVGLGTNFGASVGAKLIRLSLVVPTAEAPLVRAAVPPASPLPVATAALSQLAELPPSIETAVVPPASERPVASVKVLVRAPVRALKAGKPRVGTVGVRSHRKPRAGDNPY